MTHLFTRLRIGRRGTFLLILSGTQAILGWTTLTAPVATIHMLKVFQHLPLTQLGLTWFIPAGVAFVVAWSAQGRDAGAFILGYLGFFLWGAAYMSAWALGDLSVAAAFRPAGFYWGIAGLILVVSGWREASDE